MTQEQTNWHHLFGLMVKDFLTGTPCEVELEWDLSVKSQFLDVLIVRKTAAVIDRVLPDGLEGHLAEHNLITFKSHRETLDAWALDELLGHGVNYRKQVSPSFDDLLPKDRFRLYAIAARYPDGLARQTSFTEVQEGVYEAVWGTTTIRIVVAGRLPRTEPNALLHLFSASESLLQYGREHCRIQSAQTSTLVLELFADYRVEGLNVPITMEEFIRKARKKLIQEAPIEERLEGLTPEQLLEQVSAEEILERLPAEERLKGMTTEERLKGVPPEELIQGMTPEEREELLRLLTKPAAS